MPPRVSPIPTQVPNPPQGGEGWFHPRIWIHCWSGGGAPNAMSARPPKSEDSVVGQPYGHLFVQASGRSGNMGRTDRKELGGEERERRARIDHHNRINDRFVFGILIFCAVGLWSTALSPFFLAW